MKHLADEQKRIWEKYYSWLDAERLLFVTTNCFYYGKPAGQVVNDRLVPGAIWRSQLTHRQVPEPANEAIDKALDRLYSEGVYSKPLTFLMQGEIGQRPGWERYREYNNKKDDPLGAYITYHPLVLKRIYELTMPLLYGQREDVQQLVTEYQAGAEDIISRIKSQLGWPLEWSTCSLIEPIGLIKKAHKQFSFIGNKEAFTNLAGKFNKQLPKVEAEDDDEERLMLTTEPFNFTEEDLQRTVNKSLTAALSSYKFNQGAQFKTWFYKILEKDLIDLYREYRTGWKRGYKIKALEEYEKQIMEGPQGSILSEYLQPGFIEQLTPGQRDWINIYLKMLPGSLRANVMAETLKVSTRTERRRRKALQKLLLNNEQVFIEWNKLIKVNWPLNSLPAQSIEQAATTCKDSNCNICSYLFPNVNIKYRPCYNSIRIRKVLEKEPYFNIDISPVIIYKKPYKAIKREIPKKNNKLIFKDWQPAAIKKQPAQSKQQALMIKHYKSFTNKKKPFKVNHGEYDYKPGICSGSSFFPLASAFIETLEEGLQYYAPPGKPQQLYCKASDVKQSKVNQAMKWQKLYCNCGIRLTTTGACSRAECPLFSNNCND